MKVTRSLCIVSIFHVFLAAYRATALEVNTDFVSLTVNLNVDRIEFHSGLLHLQNSNAMMQVSEIPAPVKTNGPQLLILPAKFLKEFKQKNGQQTIGENVFEHHLNGATVYCGELVVKDLTNGFQRVSVLYKPLPGSVCQLWAITSTNLTLTNMIQKIEAN